MAETIRRESYVIQRAKKSNFVLKEAENKVRAGMGRNP